MPCNPTLTAHSRRPLLDFDYDSYALRDDRLRLLEPLHALLQRKKKKHAPVDQEDINEEKEAAEEEADNDAAERGDALLAAGMGAAEGAVQARGRTADKMRDAIQPFIEFMENEDGEWAKLAKRNGCFTEKIKTAIENYDKINAEGKRLEPGQYTVRQQVGLIPIPAQLLSLTAWHTHRTNCDASSICKTHSS